MPTNDEYEYDKHQKHQEREDRDARIRQGVMHTLGQPNGLHAVQVRRLWDNRYRVNVYVGADATSAKIVRSYFVAADAQGNIIESKPKIAVLS